MIQNCTFGARTENTKAPAVFRDYSTSTPSSISDSTVALAPTPSPIPDVTVTVAPTTSPNLIPTPAPIADLPYTITGSGKINTSTFAVPNTPFELKLRTLTGSTEGMSIDIHDPITGNSNGRIFSGQVAPTLQSTLIYGHSGLMYLTIDGPRDAGWELTILSP